jgi:hypothetical protein
MSKLLTARQAHAVWLRYERGASVLQMAQWLKISRRAVLYRLHNAKARIGRAGTSLAAVRMELPQSDPPTPRRRRMFAASQISGADERKAMTMEQV